MSARIIAILGEIAAGQEVYSIDESFLNVTGIGRLIPLETFGQQMRERIRRDTGLIIGVGFGPTKTLPNWPTMLQKNGPRRKAFWICLTKAGNENSCIWLTSVISGGLAGGSACA